jgi:hypothetical protein
MFMSEKLLRCEHEYKYPPRHQIEHNRSTSEILSILLTGQDYHFLCRSTSPIMYRSISVVVAGLAVPALTLSLPPLIPSIPGVTVPLASNAPPLPILQVPTPPLDSPPFTSSDIKPKKIGYFWTGAGDNQVRADIYEVLL